MQHHVAILYLRFWFSCALAGAVLFGTFAHGAGPAPAGARVLATADVLAAMREAAAGYDVTKSTNAVRFQTTTILQLVARARKQYSEAKPLFVGHAEWFHAMLALTGRKTDTAPVFARLAFEYKQELLIDYRTDLIVDLKRSRLPAPPKSVVSVKLWWPKKRDVPSKYSFLDTLSVPHLKVTNQRVITYCLMDLGTMVVCDRVKGLRGRPTSGILGLMFKVIGEGRVVQCRFAVAQDGLSVVWAHSKKGMLWVNTTVIVLPNGQAQKDIPAGRPDLSRLVSKLKQARINVKYLN